MPERPFLPEIRLPGGRMLRLNQIDESTIEPTPAGEHEEDIGLKPTMPARLTFTVREGGRTERLFYDGAEAEHVHQQIKEARAARDRRARGKSD